MRGGCEYRAGKVFEVDGYEYDLFVSYRRNGNVREWVRNHLVPRLYDCLADELDRDPRIFLDVAQDPGTRWPENLAWALQRSHLLLAVLSPPYFTSRWCLAEWRTIRRREQALGLGGPGNPLGLIYPIRFSDGDRFPAEARNIQHEMIFKDYRYPYPQFAESQKYLDFHRAVMEFAERLAQRFDDPPVWRADWPIELPEPSDPVPAGLPRL